MNRPTRFLGSVLLRAVGVAAFGAGVVGLAFVVLRPGDGDFFAFLASMGVVWLGIVTIVAIETTRRAKLAAMVWLATAPVTGLGLGIAGTVFAPGSPPGERVREAVSSGFFYTIPILVAVGIGAAIGLGHRKPVGYDEAGAKTDPSNRHL